MAEKIVHANVTGALGRDYVGTHCGRLALVSDTVTDPKDATCKVCQKALTKQGKREMCAGCNDNFYNGNNNLGVKECWHLEKAQLVQKKKVGINDVPPWKNQPVVTILDCRHEKGYVFVGSKQDY